MHITVFANSLRHWIWNGAATHRLTAKMSCAMLIASSSVLGCTSAPSIGNEGRDNENAQALTTPIFQVNSGGPAVGSFAVDQFATGGHQFSASNTISTAGVANAAPASLYQSERFGDFTYTFGSLTPSANYTVRLHFAEIYHTSSGARLFNVLVNGTRVANNLDIFAQAGANKALVLDYASSASSAGQISVQYVGTKDYAKSSGIEILSDTASGSGGAGGSGGGSGGASNQAPTIVTAAKPGANPVNGLTTSLSVLGADDGGEANLSYTWAVTGTPPGAVSFSANSSNAAKNTVATFSHAGNHDLSVTVRDASGASATSSVTVAVNQTLAAITVSPGTAQITVGAQQQFAATARDQFSSALATQPSMAWATSGGGTVDSSGRFTASAGAGTFTVSASSASTTGSASVTVASQPSSGTPVYQVNSGSTAVAPFSSDQFASAGNTFSGSTAVSTAGVANAAPAAVYQTERFGDFTYTFPNLTPNAGYTVRLHFAELYHTSSGSRLFNVNVNGVRVLTNLDIFALAGANQALVRDFAATATASGQVAVQYVGVKDYAKSSGIELLGGSGTSGNQAPTVAAAASASPNPVAGSSSALSVLGADDGGEANLTYTWATAGTPPGSVSFSANGTNAAKNSTATFGAAGTYTLSVTVRDANGASATSSAVVSVSQVLTSIAVTPATTQVVAGATQQFLATARDQFSSPMSPQPTLTWATNGGGSISGSGLFSASSTAGGPFTVSASTGTKSGTASVSVTASGGGGATSYSTSFDLTEAPISEGGVWNHFGLDWTYVNTSGGNAYGTQQGTGAYDDSYAYLSGFPPNQSASAVVRKDPAFSTNSSREVEILLRWSDSAHDAHGYECNLSFDGGYIQVVRWNGPLGSWAYLSGSGPAKVSGVKDGDVFSAQIVGNVVTVYFNGALVYTATDTAGPGGGAVWTSGNPGIGFWKGGGQSFAGDYGFKSFSATSVTQ